MSVTVRHLECINRRIEDSQPNTEEKAKFEKHINGYKDKLRRCNAYWAILTEMKNNRKKFFTSLRYAPAFWQMTRYSIQMCFYTDLYSMLSKDKASLSSYLPKLIAHKEQVFTRRFFNTWKDEDTGETFEEEWKNDKSNMDILIECQTRLNDLQKFVPILSEARNKVFCHLDTKSLEPEKYLNEIFENISSEELNFILKELSSIVSNLNAIYTNIAGGTYYDNQDDVGIVFNIIQIYDELKDEILNLQKRKILKQF